MGGGPRTYPGGVSKWQWKRMQAKKSKQLFKARLCREQQIYEMRKAPTLFSIRADEQLKVLADKFQRSSGYNLRTERDGPQLFQTADGLPSVGDSVIALFKC
ncbi:hypothetical protein NE237_017648 [Protea cynaroides]|uniref:Uncharacterized protein n=1 Tax=Protea cynaroides TaxID=273540 RepID=A0A9Q0K8E8_9MAGN|nr:hypothetical protein NE237_017648 [Protea cynaroides]